MQSTLSGIIALLATFGVLAALVRWRPRRCTVPLLLMGLALVVIAIDDASLIGGLRPLEGGDDGLFYDGAGRTILMHLLAGDFRAAFMGVEPVFYYGGPGLRYFRAFEHIIFGETFLGYLTLMLVFPLALLALFSRFIDGRWALLFALMFVVVPIGALFGTTYFSYVRYAGRGFADPAAYIFFICGLLPLIGWTAAGPSPRFAPAFAGALLMALAVFMKPIVAPACGIMLGGVALAALWQRQWVRIFGICAGFSFVLFMPWHNWFYGNALVLFSANAGHPLTYTMPPSAYLASAQELLSGNLTGDNMKAALVQLRGWLKGAAGKSLLIPANTMAVALLVFIMIKDRRNDPWLRLIAAAALAQHAVALFIVANPRYHMLTWLLTLIVVDVWLVQVALPWLRRRKPEIFNRFAQQKVVMRVASGLGSLQRAQV